MGFVGNYAPHGLSPQMYDMPVIPRQKVPHEHVVRDLPDSLSHGINPRCLLNHHLDVVEVILARKCTRQPNGFRSISLT